MLPRMPTSVLVLGAGFGGLELSSRLAHELGNEVDVTLIDRADAFVFGFSKLDVLFGKKDVEAIRLPYAELTTPGVRFRQETITSIDPATRRVVTDLDEYEADILIVALGADYDVAATPGLAEAGNDFYSVDGAETAHDAIRDFSGGTVIVGVCGPQFKCPPAPSECAILMDEFLRARGDRDAAEITLVLPMGAPVPPSPETSQAILDRFAERGIGFVPGHRVTSLDADTREAVLDDGTRMPYDLFLGIPVHRAPEAVLSSELVAEDGWIPVEQRTLATRFEDVFAVGDVTSVGTPRAGVFSEGAARAVAERLIARLRGETQPPGYDGTGSCYIEFGDQRVARVDVDFFSQPGHPLGTFTPPSPQTAEEKANFVTERRARWFT
jgi:sulfide:quinone oxidoreductase